MSWSAVLLAATAAHAGFQATVTLVVYPALLRVAGARWPAAHDAHSRRITPLVGVVYGVAVLAVAGSLATAPGSPGVWLAAVGTAGAVLVTATVAGPTHSQLGRSGTAGPDPRLVGRLLAADRVRLAGALLALAGAFLASG